MDNSNAPALWIYLNDHLGGATMGVALFRRPAARRTGRCRILARASAAMSERRSAAGCPMVSM